MLHECGETGLCGKIAFAAKEVRGFGDPRYSRSGDRRYSWPEVLLDFHIGFSEPLYT